MAAATGDFELTLDELRVVARFGAEAAQDVLPLFERNLAATYRSRRRIGVHRRRATPVLIEVLCRYPPVPVGKSRAGSLMAGLDAALRS